MKAPVPEDLYASLWEWVVKTQAEKRPESSLQKVIHPQQGIRLRLPGSVESPIHPVFAIRDIHIPQAYVGVIPEGRYWGGKKSVGAVITPDNRLVLDVSENIHIPNRPPAVWKQKRLPAPEGRNETVGVLTFLWGDNYFHWMIDVLGRLDLLHRSGIPIDTYLIAGPEGAAFQSETLRMLGIPEKRVLRTYPGMHIQARQLVVPSLDVYRLLPFIANPVPKWACLFLREQFGRAIGGLPSQGRERLYISREGASHRKVTNEQDVIALVAAHGFEIVRLEQIPLAEQIRLFASAEMVIAPHGAGLTNVMFCHPGTKIVDIFPTRYMYPCFWQISSYFDLQYYYLIGQGKRLTASEGIGHVSGVREPITVDIGAMSAMLRLIGA